MRGIWRYTSETWGPDQAERYFDRIEACCEAVGEGRAVSRSFDALPDGVRMYRCEHHYIIWMAGARPVIIAILHERMHLVKRLSDRL